MKATWALALKDVRLLIRDKAALIWVIAFPLMIGVLFGYVFGGTSEMPPITVAIVDQDNSAASKALVDELAKFKSLKIEKSTEETARTGVRTGSKVAYILIPKNYGSYDPFEKIPDSAALQLGTDPSRKIESGMLEGMLQGAAYRASFASMQDPNGGWKKRVESGLNSNKLDPETRDFLKHVDKYMSTSHAQIDMQSNGPKIVRQSEQKKGIEPANSFEVTFPQALVWGILGVVSTFAISLVKERQQGTFLRLVVSPMSFARILAGKGLACFLSTEAVMMGLLLVGHFLFKIRLGDPLILGAAIVSTGVAFVGIMLLLSTLGKTEQAVSGSVWGVMILMAMFGGGMLPLGMMPQWMQSASNLSPLKWTTLAVEGAIWRGFGWSEMFTPCAILLGIGIVAYLIGTRTIRKSSV